jgi:hypothetical protein
MSRAKRFDYDGGHIWMDYKSQVATVEQLELLSDLSGTPIDDLLDEGLGQKEVSRRLHEINGFIPPEVLERRRARREAAKHAPVCRWCDPRGLVCEGYSTKHHYVPRWIMLMLENYQAYAARSRCTIPICLGAHRTLHQRGDHDKSIVDCLTEDERAFARKMLDELKVERPVVFDFISGGNAGSYEGQLLRDYREGRLNPSETVRMAEDASETPSAMVEVAMNRY